MFLIRRNRIFHFRRRVPSALRSILNKREIVKSLKTSDPVAASIEAAKLLASTSKQFEELFARPVQIEVSALSDAQIQQICQQYIHLRISEIDDFKRTLSKQHRLQAYEHFCEEIESSEHILRRSVAIGEFEIFDDVLPVFLAEQGIRLASSIDQHSAGKLRSEFAKANVTLLNLKKQIMNGEYPKLEPRPLRGISVFTIKDALNAWERIKGRNPKTRDEVHRLVRQFSEYSSDDLDAIEKKKIRDFFIQRSHLARETLIKQAGLLRAVCATAIDDGLIKSNPFANLKIDFGLDSESRDPFSNDDVIRIFGSSYLLERPDLEFLSILGLITGARIEELAQLRPCDFRYEDGIFYVSIDRLDGKTTKTIGSIRKTPIHPQVCDYVKSYIADKPETSSIFSEPHNKYGKFGAPLSKQFSYLLKSKLKIDGNKCFHSFRHTIKTMARELGVHEEIHDAITGHASNETKQKNSSGRSYGIYTLKTKLEALQKIDLSFLRYCRR